MALILYQFSTEERKNERKKKKKKGSEQGEAPFLQIKKKKGIFLAQNNKFREFQAFLSNCPNYKKSIYFFRKEKKLDHRQESFK